MLAVDVLLCSIGKVDQLPCVSVALASAIDLQLNAHKKKPGTVEHWFGLVVVGLDGFLMQLAVTFVTVIIAGIIIVDGVLVVDQPAAFLASGIVVFVTTHAQDGVVVPLGVVAPDPTAAVIAQRGVLLKAIFAQRLTVVIIRLVLGQDSSANGAGFRFVHGKISFFGLYWFITVKIIYKSNGRLYSTEGSHYERKNTILNQIKHQKELILCIAYPRL
jgi:hypothetical protein